MDRAESDASGARPADGLLRVSCLQLNPGNDLAQNIEVVTHLATQAVAQGGQLIVTPEFCFKLDGRGAVMLADVPEEADHAGALAMRDFARQHGVWFLIGAVVVRTETERFANRSLLIAPDGSIAARYDKLHMFDITLPDGRQVFESKRYQPGAVAQIADTPIGLLGLTICYDVRFPQLFQALAKAGANIILLPAAFYRATGTLHWHTLVRARAIETGAYIVAPATCGEHPGEHATYGHTLVVSPSGEILLDGGDEPGVWTLELDLAQVRKTRARLPSLQHGRPFELATATVRPDAEISQFNDRRVSL